MHNIVLMLFNKVAVAVAVAATKSILFYIGLMGTTCLLWKNLKIVFSYRKKKRQNAFLRP